MAFSLYAAVVPPYLQILGSVSEWLVKARTSCAERKIPETDLVQACLAPDMLPFAYQVKATGLHSIGAIEAIRKGVFVPDATSTPATIAELQSRVAATLTALAAVVPAEVDGFVGRDVCFSLPSRNLRLDFTAEDFLTSFSMPNFYFHATTAYDILRWKGVAIGKRDFMGQLRVKS